MIAELTELEVIRLVVLRERYRAGELSEQTQETKRLLFARWLVEHRKISEEVTR